MLQQPSISIESIAGRLEVEFGLQASEIVFLPIGADLNTAAYRVLTRDGCLYFLKLRCGDFKQTSVMVPRLLSDLGLPCLIPPLPTRNGTLWASLDSFNLILYPFIDGQDAYEAGMSDLQWVQLGELLQLIHAASLPAAVLNEIGRETWSSALRESLKTILEALESFPPLEPLRGDMLAFLKAQRGTILGAISQANRLAVGLQRVPPGFCLCHGDLHAGNLLLTPTGDLYLVDWDDLLLAPKEKDLMSVGGGMFGNWRTSSEEETFFYQGYGPVEVNPDAITYYRLERVIADLEVECRQILGVNGNLADRQQAFTWMESNFLPNGALSIALHGAADH
jgi:spectinomycin phosphotransferase